MTFLSYILVALLLLASPPAAMTIEEDHATTKVRIPPDDLTAGEMRTITLYRSVLPTLVTIRTTASGSPGEPRPGEGQGSGVIMSSGGYILTAAHVVEGAHEILIKMHQGEVRHGELVFSESSADIALVRILSPPPGLVPAKLGDSDRLAIGQTVYVAGSPFGLENSFSVGHISGFREFDRLYDGTILAEFIQTDAAINSGNSGGPVYNSSGEVIGIASRILTHSGGFEGLGFAVSINTAKQLLALEDRAWMGFEGIFLNREGLARLLNVDHEGGVLIQRIVKGSPAEKAGLRSGSIPATIFGQEILLGGDLILRIDTQEACHGGCLVRKRKHLAGRDRIPIQYLRGGVLHRTKVDVSGTRRNYLEDLGGI